LPEIINENDGVIMGETIVKQDTIVGYMVSAENYKRKNK
jgi:hypothetical protein